MTNNIVEEAVNLDRKLVNAVSKLKGVQITYKQLALMAELGVFELIANHRNEILKEASKCQPSKVSMKEEILNSAGIERKPANSAHPISLSSGMIANDAVSVASQRAQQMFK